MSLFSKFDSLASRRKALDDTGAQPFNVVVERIISPTEAIVNGRETILAGTNNYLGLTFHPECVQASVDAVELEGAGTTGSRMANGTFASHVALERDIAEFFGRNGAIVFSTGYLANLGILSALTDRDDVIVIDGDCHASIYDGCLMGGAEVIRFRHNDADDLAKRLRRLGDRAADVLIVVEGIYSMLGDRAPMSELAAVKREYGGYLLVDEAHSLGVLGASGLVEVTGEHDSIDFITGTFSKSLGATGGFCVSDLPGLELIRVSSRPYVFTASMCPSVIASTRAALAVLRRDPELRDKLWRNANRLYAQLSELGLKLGPEPSPVIAAMLTDVDEALALWTGLLERGVYVNLVFPPATPNGSYLLRCSVSAAHTTTQIDRICAAFAKAQKDYATSSAA
ncbi:MAG: aminotransferase class I/II-fold pyridoxal phosphate-dependent enzyme [Gammaproteobacteria bacterium]